MESIWEAYQSNRIFLGFISAPASSLWYWRMAFKIRKAGREAFGNGLSLQVFTDPAVSRADIAIWIILSMPFFALFFGGF